MISFVDEMLTLLSTSLSVEERSFSTMTLKVFESREGYALRDLGPSMVVSLTEQRMNLLNKCCLTRQPITVDLLAIQIWHGGKLFSNERVIRKSASTIFSQMTKTATGEITFPKYCMTRGTGLNRKNKMNVIGKHETC